MIVVVRVSEDLVCTRSQVRHPKVEDENLKVGKNTIMERLTYTTPEVRELSLHLCNIPDELIGGVDTFGLGTLFINRQVGK